jgi:hypothetical protein
MFQPTISPPEKLSELIRMALKDLATVEADPRYKIDMLEWHRPECRGHLGTAMEPLCSLCMAGAIMACRLGAAPDEYLVPGSFSGDWAKALSAVNDFSMGFVDAAVEGYTEVEVKQPVHDDCVPFRYNEDPAAFKTSMASFVHQLEAQGL